MKANHKIERDNNHYYLYRHIRLDKNEPFYIGIGVKPKKHDKTIESEYKRAFAKNGRNNIWNKITLKTDYRVDIIIEHSNKDFVVNKEIEFIKLYGRKDLNSGILSNMTDGGEGIKNKIVSKETRDKISKFQKGSKRTQEQCLNISKSKFIKVIKLNLNGEEIEEFESLSSAAKSLNCSVGEITVCCKNQNRICHSFKWKYKD